MAKTFILYFFLLQRVMGASMLEVEQVIIVIALIRVGLLQNRLFIKTWLRKLCEWIFHEPVQLNNSAACCGPVFAHSTDFFQGIMIMRRIYCQVSILLEARSQIWIISQFWALYIGLFLFTMIYIVFWPFPQIWALVVTAHSHTR